MTEGRQTVHYVEGFLIESEDAGDFLIFTVSIDKRLAATVDQALPPGQFFTELRRLFFRLRLEENKTKP